MTEKNSKGSANKTDQDHPKSFEDAIKELQRLTQILENQDLPLEEAVEVFEKGMQLSRYCSKLLEQAEEKIKILTREEDSNQVLEKDFPEDINP